MKPPSLPQGLEAVTYLANECYLREKELSAALLAAGIPVVQLHIPGQNSVRYVDRKHFDRWFVANIKPVKGRPTLGAAEKEPA